MEKYSKMDNTVAMEAAKVETNEEVRKLFRETEGPLIVEDEFGIITVYFNPYDYRIQLGYDVIRKKLKALCIIERRIARFELDGFFCDVIRIWFNPIIHGQEARDESIELIMKGIESMPRI